MGDKAIRVHIDTKEIQKAEKLLREKGPKAVERAAERALKTGASTFKSASKGGAPSVYQITAGELAKTISVHSDAFTVKSRLLTAGKKPAHFSIKPGTYKPGRRPASVRVKKNGGFQSEPGAFVANPAKVNGGTVMLWKRTRGKFQNTRNAAMEPVRRVSAAQMLQNPEVEEHVMDAIGEMFSKRIDHELKRAGI